MSRTIRFLAFVSLAVTAATVAPAAHATGGVLAPSSDSDPKTLDIQIAVTKVAGAPPSSTRWSRITVGGVSSVLWLVPVRPGAAVDYSNDAWLDALDDTTAPRVGPRIKPADCDVKEDVERVETWGAVGTKRYPKAVTLLESEAQARAHAAALDHRVSSETGTRIHDAYARGWSFLALEIATPYAAGTPLSSSPTVRVRDDGGLLPGGSDGLVPLALTGSTAVAARVTAWVIGDGGAELPNTRDVPSSAIVWSEKGSSFGKHRSTELWTSQTWIRESSSHDVFFSELALPKSTPLPPLYAAYFGAASGGPRPECETSTLGASNSLGVVRRACVAGAVANVAGGEPCTPGNGAIDPAAFTCGAGIDDLAFALSNVSPARVVATRFAGSIGKASFGTDMAIASVDVAISPLHEASRTECESPTKNPPSSSGSGSSSGTNGLPQGGGAPIGGGAGGSSSGTGRSYWTRTDSCSGTSLVYVSDTGQQQPVYDDEGCGGSTETVGAGGGSSSSSSSGGSSSGWDVDDNSSVGSGSSSSSSSSSDDGCGGSSSSSSSDGCGGDSGSSSDDSCGGGSSSSSSSDGCDSSSSSSSDSCSSSSSSSDSCSGGGGGDSCSCAKGAGATNGVGGERLFPKSVAKNARANAAGSGRSPVSRFALFFAALVLPLRRRLRNTTWKW